MDLRNFFKPKNATAASAPEEVRLKQQEDATVSVLGNMAHGLRVSLFDSRQID